MKRYGIAALAVFTAAGLACGSSEEKPPPTPAASQPGTAYKLSPEKQKALDALHWAGVGEPRDKIADSAVCEARADSDPALRGPEYSLAKLQRWVECMKSYGWTPADG